MARNAVCSCSDSGPVVAARRNGVHVVATSNHNAAWDLGAGVMGFFGEHVGLRGEIRHFRSFGDFDVLGVTVDNTKLRYNRASAGVVFKF